MNHRAGHLRTIPVRGYQAFVPCPLPAVPPVHMTGAVVALLIRAHSGLAVLEMVAGRTPNAAVFVSMPVRKEALLSSQIEGMHATLEDVLDHMTASSTNSSAAAVAKCIKATEFAIRRPKELPLCNRLL